MSGFKTQAIAACVPVGLMFAMALGAQAQQPGPAFDNSTSSVRNSKAPEATATFPLVFCWYKGQVLYYIQIDTSDQKTAEAFGLNYVPQLENVLSSEPPAYDDIYTVTNFKQYNVVPSSPNPVGPKNTDRTYQPLWQVSKVTWNAGVKPRTLRSEEEILSARDSGELTVTKTNIVINCPIIGTREGGTLPGVKIKLDRNNE